MSEPHISRAMAESAADECACGSSSQRSRSCAPGKRAPLRLHRC